MSSLSAWLRWEQWFGALGLKGFAGITLSGHDGITEDKPSHLSIHSFHSQVFMPKGSLPLPGAPWRGLWGTPTAIFLCSLQVKAEKSSRNLARLQECSRNVNEMAANVVASTKSGQEQIEEKGEVFARKRWKNPAQIPVWPGARPEVPIQLCLGV